MTLYEDVQYQCNLSSFIFWVHNMNSCKNTHSVFIQDIFTNYFILFLGEARELGRNPHRLWKNMQKCAQTETRAQDRTGDPGAAILHQCAPPPLIEIQSKKKKKVCIQQKKKMPTHCWATFELPPQKMLLDMSKGCSHWIFLDKWLLHSTEIKCKQRC